MLLKFFQMLMFIGLILLSKNIFSEEKIDVRYLLDIPQQSVEDALQELATKTGKQLFFSYGVIGVQRSNSLTGSLTLEHALEELLKGTGISGRLTKTGVIVVAPKKKTERGKNTMNAKKNILSTAIAFLVGAGGAPHLLAQGEDKFFEEADQLIEELLVVGTAGADRKATALKESADGIMDVYAADDLGSLPELNVTDVFRRIAGVNTLLGDGDDEGQYIVIRGLQSNKANFDGMGMASDSSGRRANLEAIPASAIVKAEVNKSMSASMDGQGLGGNINLGTLSAFANKERVLRIDVEGAKYTMDDAPQGKVGIGHTAGITFADTFGANDQFGVVVAFSDAVKKREVVKAMADTNWQSVSGEEDLAPNINRLWSTTEQNTVDRTGGLIKFEFQSDQFYAFLDAFYYEKSETRNRTEFSIRDKGSVTPQDGGNGLGNIANIHEKGEAQSLGRNRNWDRDNARAHFHIDTVFNDDHAVNFDIVHGKAGSLRDDEYWDFKTKNGRSELGYTLNTFEDWSVNDPDYLTNADNYSFKGYNNTLQSFENEMTEAKVDYQFSTDQWDLSAGAKFGTYAWEKDYSKTNYKNYDGDLLDGELLLSDFTVDDNYNYTAPGWSTVEPFQDFTFPTFLHDNISDFEGYSEEKLLEEELKSDFYFEEDISAAYVMGRYAASQWSAALGVRIEHTRMNSSSWSDDADNPDTNSERFVAVENSTSYTNVLPSFNFAYHFSDELRLRLALSKSISRPNPGDTSAKFKVNRDAGGNADSETDYDVAVSRNNKSLKPQESTNYDLSLEYYFDDLNAMASLAVFHKSIDNGPITIDSFVDEDPDYEGLRVRYREMTNLDSRDITGYELSFKKQSFAFLPAMLQGLGVSANATWQSANVQYDGLDFDYFKNQPEFIGNATMYYSFLDDRGEARLAYNYTGEYTQDFKPDDSWKEQRNEEYGLVDLKLRFKVIDNLTVSAKVRNLTNAKREKFNQGFGGTYYVRDIEFGRSLWLGVNYKM